MLLDKQAEFSDAQLITGSAASTNYLDTQHAGDWGLNDPWLTVRVNTVLDSAGEAATLVVKVYTDNDSAFGSPTTLWTSATLAEATLVAGYTILRLRLSDLGTLERYIEIYYTDAVEEFTSGAIDAFLTWDPEKSW